ncbi:MAG: proline--tRNA ligase [Gammaproteobacteria bacterium]
MKNKTTAITPTRNENFPEWYQEVIKAADLAEHAAIRGCMIIKPRGYALWEAIQATLDRMIKATGHQNVYFPLLIPLEYLAQEAAHVEGFAKECAVVTHYRLEADAQGQLVPAPSAQLAEPLIIRPTSETLFGTAMAKWVQSYQDLPILLNQWCNVMRWEMRTRLFLRTSEFLWQEGHTAHATAAEAETETAQMLDVYETLVRDYLAIPVIKGRKTPAERFPGAVETYTIEAMMQDGKALQAGTSHFLGQNFSKAYNITFTDRSQATEHAWTTSWGLSTRIIGALIMVHSDDDGLVLPPRIAPEQVILIPVAMNADDLPAILGYCQTLQVVLSHQQYAGTSIRVVIDKTEKRAGEKFWQAVKKGTPIRIEIGRKEMESKQFSLSRRDKPAKEKVQLTHEQLLAQIPGILEEIQQNLLQRALAFREKHTVVINTLEELKALFSEDNAVDQFAMAYFDPAIENSPNVVEVFKALKISTRCIPLEQSNISGTCIFSGKSTNQQVILARAY